MVSSQVRETDVLWPFSHLDVIRNKGYNSRMMTYATLQSDCREFLALTGLTLQEFQLLLNAFTPAYERRYPKDRTLADRPRQRCAGGGRKGTWTVRSRSCYSSWSISRLIRYRSSWANSSA